MKQPVELPSVTPRRMTEMVVSSYRAELAGVVEMLLSGGGGNASEKGGSLETVSESVERVSRHCSVASV